MQQWIALTTIITMRVTSMEPKTHQQRLDDVCLSFRNDCQRALTKALESGKISEKMLNDEGYGLAKAIIDSEMKKRDYYLDHLKADFNNIHSILEPQQCTHSP